MKKLIEYENINSKIALIKQNIISQLNHILQKKSRLNIVKCKRIVRSFIKYRRIPIQEENFFWIDGLLAEGLLSCVIASDDTESLIALEKFYDNILEKNKLFYRCFYLPDQIIHANVLLMLYKYKKIIKYLPLIEKAKEFIKNESAQDSEKVIHYRGKNFDFYIDSLGMIIQFCVNYSKVFGDIEMKEIAHAQIDFTLKKCINKQTQLPYHVYKFSELRPVGPSTWGRGIGWFLIGLTELLVSLDIMEEQHSMYKDVYLQVIEQVFNTQDENGYLYNDIVTKDHIDTSTTAMIGYCLGLGLINNLIPEKIYEMFFQVFKKTVFALLESTDSFGNVNNSSGECKGVGNYSDVYGNFFAQGHTVLCFYLYLQIKNTNMKLGDGNE